MAKHFIVFINSVHCMLPPVHASSTLWWPLINHPWMWDILTCRQQSLIEINGGHPHRGGLYVMLISLLWNKLFPYDFHDIAFVMLIMNVIVMTT